MSTSLGKAPSDWGKRQIFEQCFHAWYDGLHRYANTILKNDEETRDIIQNAFLALWEKREQIDLVADGRPYIYVTVRNRCLNVIRDRKRQLSHLHNLSQDLQVSNPTIDIDSRKLEQEIHKAIALLPERCKEVFQKSRHEGKKYAEIATEMDISVKTVESQMGKALKILREKLAHLLPVVILFFLLFYLYL